MLTNNRRYPFFACACIWANLWTRPRMAARQTGALSMATVSVAVWQALTPYQPNDKSTMLIPSHFHWDAECVCVCLCPPRYVCSRSRQSRAPKTRMQSRLVGVKKKRKKLSLLFLYLFKYLSFGLFVRSPWALGTYRGMFHYFLIFIVFFYRLKFQNVANPDISGDFSTLLKELIHQFVLKVSNIRRKKKNSLVSTVHILLQCQCRLAWNRPLSSTSL